MPDEVTLDVTTIEENVTVETTAGDVVEIQVVAPTGPTGATGPAGPNSVTSATTSDGTANLSLSNVSTATATVSSLLTAGHIHGNLAGTLYTHVRTGEAMSKGDPFYISGFHVGSSQPIAMRADASDPLKMPAVGVMDADYANNTSSANGIISGTLSSVDTDGYSVNSPIYVANGGGYSNTAGTIPQQIGITERANVSTGAFIVTNSKVISFADVSDAQTGTADLILENLTATNLGSVTASIGSSLIVGDGDSVNGRYDIFSNTSHFQWYSDSVLYGERSFTITTENLTSSGSYVYKYPVGNGTLALTEKTNGEPDKLTAGTISGATTFNATSYTYGTGAAAAHRTALGLDLLFNNKANLTGGNSFSGEQTIATTGATAALALRTTSTSSAIVLETALAASATGTTSIAVGRALTTNNAAIFGHGASYAYAHVQGRTAADFNVQSSGNVCIGTTTDNNSFGGAKLQVRGQGSSTANWRGRIVAGGDNAVFLMGEYNSGAWLGAHNGSLSAWADMYVQAQGGKDLCIAYDGASFYANSRIITGATLAMGTASPNARALIDMTSTTKGFLPPRMTTAQRDAISSPPAGLMIYNTTTNKLNVFTTAWEQVISA